MDQSPRAAHSLRVENIFKTNPVSQALHFSQCNEHNVLFVGGEMSDTILYLVYPQCDVS